jgi:protein MpaA
VAPVDLRDRSHIRRSSDRAGREKGLFRRRAALAWVACLVALLTSTPVLFAGCPVIGRFAASAAIALPEFSAAGAEDPSESLTAARSPARTRVELGRSANGAPLTMELLGEGPETLLVVGGIHGDEPSGAEVADTLAAFLCTHPEYLTGRRVGILARANPDGLLSGTRANARGIDLNRNFPSRDWRSAPDGEMSHGPTAASEPETQAVVSAIEILGPSRVIDIHSITRGLYCNNYDGPAEYLARLMTKLNGYPVSADIGYPTPGALGCWLGIDLGIPTITLELPRGLSPERCWRDNAAALLAFIDGSHDRVVCDFHLQAGSP